MHANPLDYVNAYAWSTGNDSPMVVGIDAIVEAGMIPAMAIDLDTDARVPPPITHISEHCHLKDHRTYLRQDCEGFVACGARK